MLTFLKDRNQRRCMYLFGIMFKELAEDAYQHLISSLHCGRVSPSISLRVLVKKRLHSVIQEIGSDQTANKKLVKVKQIKLIYFRFFKKEVFL